jgi:hypothetical protein
MTMHKLADLHWRKRRKPTDTLVGKVADFWIMVVPRHPRPSDVGIRDLPSATVFISTSPSIEGLTTPEEM